MPSSFSIVLSSALVYSTSPPVSVSGTVLRGGYFLGPLHRPSNLSISTCVGLHDDANIRIIFESFTHPLKRVKRVLPVIVWIVSCQLTEQQEVEVGLKFNGTSFNV